MPKCRYENVFEHNFATSSSASRRCFWKTEVLSLVFEGIAAGGCFGNEMFILSSLFTLTLWTLF